MHDRFDRKGKLFYPFQRENEEIERKNEQIQRKNEQGHFFKERAMNWKEVCDHPDLRDLPFKIELNERGQIVMSPAKVYHSMFQGEIAGLLRFFRKEGKILTECAIRTHKGTKVADVAWASNQTFARIKDGAECSIAPEICIEILSASNSDSEIEEKKALYFSRGAREVWLCDEAGKMAFFIPGDKIKCSEIFPDFPLQLDIEAK